MTDHAATRRSTPPTSRPAAGRPSGSPEPAGPTQAGVPVPEPAQVDVEPVHLLANEVRDELRSRGFDDEQIDDWSRAYFAEHTGGTGEDLLAWIALQERER